MASFSLDEHGIHVDFDGNAELVAEAVIGDRIWTDNGSGANRDFGAWQIEVSDAYRSSRLAGDHGSLYGTLDSGLPLRTIANRALPIV